MQDMDHGHRNFISNQYGEKKYIYIHKKNRSKKGVKKKKKKQRISHYYNYHSLGCSYCFPLFLYYHCRLV